MATPRKHWFRVSDCVAHEPWSNDAVAAFTRLLAHLNTRWAREGRTADEACEVVLSRGTAMQLTGSGSLARARSILRELATHVSLVIDEQGTNTLIRWRNFAIFQHLASDSGVRVETDAGSAVPPPQDAPAPAPARRKTHAPTERERRPLAPAERLVNVLSQEPGSREAKLAFCEKNLALWEAEADREGARNGARRSGVLRSLAIRYWRQELRPKPVAAGGREMLTPDEQAQRRIREMIRRDYEGGQGA